MPFVAIDPNGERVCSLDHNNDLRMDYPKGGSFKCQLCSGEMIYRRSIKARPHFAHKPNAPCSSDYEHKPESPMHLQAKAEIRDHLIKIYKGAEVELEYRMPEIKRVADVMAIVNGFKEAHEIQMSPITAEVLERRTLDYETLGISVVWWFGPKCSDIQREWSYGRFGEYNSIKFRL